MKHISASAKVAQHQSPIPPRKPFNLKVNVTSCDISAMPHITVHPSLTRNCI